MKLTRKNQMIIFAALCVAAGVFFLWKAFRQNEVLIDYEDEDPDPEPEPERKPDGSEPAGE